MEHAHDVHVDTPSYNEQCGCVRESNLRSPAWLAGSQCYTQSMCKMACLMGVGFSSTSAVRTRLRPSEKSVLYGGGAPFGSDGVGGATSDSSDSSDSVRQRPTGCTRLTCHHTSSDIVRQCPTVSDRGPTVFRQPGLCPDRAPDCAGRARGPHVRCV